jgi:3-(3-hydroxy-phenyl)propionate hydroxylase
VFDGEGALAAKLTEKLATAMPATRVLRIAPHVPLAAKAEGARTDDAVADPHGRIREAYGAREGNVYLLRPDGHVAARWQAPDAEQVRAALDRSLGRQPH